MEEHECPYCGNLIEGDPWEEIWCPTCNLGFDAYWKHSDRQGIRSAIVLDVGRES